MHEMSIVLSFVKMAEEYAVKNNAAKVVKVVLQVGEISGIVPRYLHEFYPVVIEGTILEGSELVIETVEASVFCSGCATTYNPTKTDLKCPNCGSEQCDVIDGRGLFVKEIVIAEASTSHCDTEATNG
jgi:hydrogenase nickel incorporation protein HypA/HybF